MKSSSLSVITPLILITSLFCSESIPPLTPAESAQLVKFRNGDYTRIAVVEPSGKRLHEIINNPDKFTADEISGAITGHEAQNYIHKQVLKCWDATFLESVIKYGGTYSVENTANIADNLRSFTSYPNAKNEAINLINRFDYSKFTNDELRGKYYSIAGYSKLNNKAYSIQESINDFKSASLAYRIANNDEQYCRMKIEEVKAKMANSVYEQYMKAIDDDFNDLSNFINKIDQEKSLIGSFYHTRGLHQCNKGMMNDDINLVQNALSDFKKARDHKLQHLNSANAYAATTKLYGDVALRLALKFNDDPIGNIKIAKDMYTETFSLNSDFSFEEYKGLVYSFYLCLDKLDEKKDFMPFINEYNERDETHPNLKAAIQFTLAMINKKD